MIVGEPSNNELRIGHRGRAIVKIAIKGKRTHTSKGRGDAGGRHDGGAGDLSGATPHQGQRLLPRGLLTLAILVLYAFRVSTRKVSALWEGLYGFGSPQRSPPDRGHPRAGERPLREEYYAVFLSNGFGKSSRKPDRSLLNKRGLLLSPSPFPSRSPLTPPFLL